MGRKHTNTGDVGYDRRLAAMKIRLRLITVPTAIVVSAVASGLYLLETMQKYQYDIDRRTLSILAAHLFPVVVGRAAFVGAGRLAQRVTRRELK